jgi:hypothetical protein
MSQLPPRGNRPTPPIPERSARRGSVLRPPPGTETGSGYTASPSFSFPRPPPRIPTPSSPRGAPTESSPRIVPREPPPPLAGPSILRNSRGIPNVFEDAPVPRRQRQRQSSSSGAGTMFYPSTTTVSSMESGPGEPSPPMPFFRTDPYVQSTGSLATLEESPDSSHDSSGRAVSLASSGVLGIGAIEVDPDSDSDTYTDDGSSITEFDMDQLVRGVSLVRRGQARMMRNPSTNRRSVYPEVSPFCKLIDK